MSDIMSPACKQVCDEMTPLLRDYAKEAGLESELADSLSLTWDGETFQAVSAKALDTAEYGDGRGPAPRPVHKALNRLELDVEARLTELLGDRVLAAAEGVRF